MIKILATFIVLFLLVLLYPLSGAIDFKNVSPLIFKYEGTKYHDYPNDPGGPTKFGWTLRSYRSMVDREATINTIKFLSKNKAANLYEYYWWNKFGASRLVNHNLALCIILAQINLGANRPNRLLQETVNDVCHKKLTIDGVLGTKSLDAINECQIWPMFPFILHDFYFNNPEIAPVWKWAKKGLTKRILHGVEN